MGCVKGEPVLPVERGLGAVRQAQHRFARVTEDEFHRVEVLDIACRKTTLDNERVAGSALVAAVDRARDERGRSCGRVRRHEIAPRHARARGKACVDIARDRTARERNLVGFRIGARVTAIDVSCNVGSDERLVSPRIAARDAASDIARDGALDMHLVLPRCAVRRLTARRAARERAALDVHFVLFRFLAHAARERPHGCTVERQRVQVRGRVRDARPAAVRVVDRAARERQRVIVCIGRRDEEIVREVLREAAVDRARMRGIRNRAARHLELVARDVALREGASAPCQLRRVRRGKVRRRMIFVVIAVDRERRVVRRAVRRREDVFVRRGVVDESRGRAMVLHAPLVAGVDVQSRVVSHEGVLRFRIRAVGRSGERGRIKLHIPNLEIAGRHAVRERQHGIACRHGADDELQLAKVPDVPRNGLPLDHEGVAVLRIVIVDVDRAADGHGRRGGGVDRDGVASRKNDVRRGEVCKTGVDVARNRTARERDLVPRRIARRRVASIDIAREQDAADDELVVLRIAARDMRAVNVARNDGQRTRARVADRDLVIAAAARFRRAVHAA